MERFGAELISEAAAVVTRRFQTFAGSFGAGNPQRAALQNFFTCHSFRNTMRA